MSRESKALASVPGDEAAIVRSVDREAGQLESIAAHVRGILSELRVDQNDPHLKGTDERVAEMYLEMFQGLKEGTEPRVKTFPNDENYTHMVMEKDIPFYSMCAHHLVPFYGHAHIGYIPDETIIGLSKFSRILEFYAKRPQLQERLTEQVVQFLEERLQPQGAMVVIEARHLCVEMRGVKKPGALTVTSAIRGVFHRRPVREEFLDLLRRRQLRCPGPRMASPLDGLDQHLRPARPAGIRLPAHPPAHGGVGRTAVVVRGPEGRGVGHGRVDPGHGCQLQH